MFFLVKKFVEFSVVHPLPFPALPRLTGGGREGLGESTYRGLSGVESHAVRQESYEVHAEQLIFMRMQFLMKTKKLMVMMMVRRRWKHFRHGLSEVAIL